MDGDNVIDRNPLPDEVGDRLRAQITFVAEADRLKTILRASPLAAADRRENDAEHSWHLALMVLVLAEYACEPVDVGHTLKLVIVHDMVEIYAGDSPVYEPRAASSQRQREVHAAGGLFALLPADQAEMMRSLWEEFEGGRSAEARFAKSMDRFEPMLLNWLNRGGTWRSPGATESTVRAQEVSVIASGTSLGDVSELLMRSGLQNGWIRPD